MKRICIDVNSAIPLIVRGYSTGVGRTVFELVSTLNELKNQLPFELVVYFQSMKKIQVADSGITFKQKQIYFPFRFNINKYISPFHLRTALTKSDLWHCPHNSDYVDRKSRTIFTIHDLIVLECKGEFPEKEVERVKRELPPLLQGCQAIITCSESSKNDIVKHMQVAPEKVHVTNWGINHQLFRPCRDKDSLLNSLSEKFQIRKPYFFSVSCGYGRKNTLSLLHAYKELLKQHPQHDLVLIWKNYGEDVAKILDECKGRIRVLNNVPDNDLVKLYNGCTASFYPSLYEGFGLPVLEAMACGVPVVTCANSSLTEVGGNAAIYASSTESKSLVEIMERFEQKEYDTEKIIRKGIEHSSTYTWKTCAEKTIDIYSMYL